MRCFAKHGFRDTQLSIIFTPMSRRLPPYLAYLVVIVLVPACAGQRSAPSPSGSSVSSPAPSSSPRAEHVGDLRSVDGECFLLFTGHGAYELDLPAGYQLSPKDGSADVLSPDGGVVAPAGELIGVNGELDKDAQTTCGVPILRSSEVLLFEVDMDAPPCQISMGGDLGDAVRQVEAEVANDNLTAESLLRAADAVDQLALQLSSVDRAHAESLASTLRANASDPDGDALSEALFWYRAEYGVRCGTMVVD